MPVLQHETEHVPKLQLSLQYIFRPCTVQHVAIVSLASLSEDADARRICISVIICEWLELEAVEVEHLTKLYRVCQDGKNELEAVILGLFLLHLTDELEQEATVVLLQHGLQALSRAIGHMNWQAWRHG